ncbi:MAG TPA: PAS domain-containing sensor histidine kinase [Candidatus Udaeobacter sp.]|nr:PAS domain-containing sensor histidine kinase [Candidatus Udaeobacter sp.]
MKLLGGWAPEYLAAIVDSTDDAVIGKTLDGTIISWNKGAERIYGYTPDEVVGRPISILIPSDRADELPAILSRIARGERINHYLTKRVRKDGVVLDISVTISPVQVATGKIVGASAIARDVTAQQYETKEALRIRDEFISVAAHELRTPLTTMFARLELVQRRLARNELDPAIVLRDLTLVRQAADRLKVLIDRLLDISRIRSGQLQVERSSIDIAPMIESVALMISETSARQITVLAPDPPESYRMDVDGMRIEEVVVNLIDNAVKYSPKDTPVDVELRSTPDAIRIAVRDRGPGIEIADRTRIFEPFHRSSSSGVPGVGLGLHIAKQIVELHGGTLNVETPADGGSRFVVTIPRNAEGELGDDRPRDER